jgi:hypothetical protein
MMSIATQPHGTFASENREDALKFVAGAGEGVATTCATIGASGAFTTFFTGALYALAIVIALLQALTPVRPSADVTVTIALLDPAVE